MNEVTPVVLQGRLVRVEPLTVAHAEGLRLVGDPSVFALSVVPRPEPAPEGFRDYVERAIATPGRLPFAIVLQDGDVVVGTTSYFDIRREHGGLEIGYTWIGPAYQGTQVNPENKYLLLRHAFETLGAIRVQLKTDSRNAQSQRAMLKLGAKLEGTLRNHMILPDGSIRHTVMFSITGEEWPGVKAALEERLGYAP